MARLALPSIAAQVINILYNIVDRIYIGHIAGASSLALTGMGVCFPVITLVSAFSTFAGAGASLAAIELGKGEHDAQAGRRTQAILGNAVLLLLCFSAALTAVFLACKTPLLRAFGASAATLPYADGYLAIYLCGTLFVQLSLGLNPFISAQGFAGTAMLSTVIGAAANCLLDPVFIFALGMGVRGAALATVISQAASALWIVLFLCGVKTRIRLRAGIIRADGAIIARIAALGLSPFVMAATESAVFVVFNSSLQAYGGDLHVGAMTILQGLMQLGYVPVQGFADGVQPLIGYNYGAGHMGRVRSIIARMTLVTFAGTVLANIVFSCFPAFFAGLFTEDGALLAVATRLLPPYFGAIWIFGVQMSAQRTFVALGMARTSIFIALLRKVFLLIPLALVLPRFLGVTGIYLAEPAASTVSAVTAGILLLRRWRRI